MKDPQGNEFWMSWNANMNQWKSQWKNMIICLVIMFAAGDMVIKMLKMSLFLYFLLMLAKSYSKFGESVYVYLKDLI